MNKDGAFKRLNKLYIMVRRMKVSLGKNEQGITPNQKKFIMEQIKQIAVLIR